MVVKVGLIAETIKKVLVKMVSSTAVDTCTIGFSYKSRNDNVEVLVLRDVENKLAIKFIDPPSRQPVN